jgi:cell wall-associated NlpC family hydrolase
MTIRRWFPVCLFLLVGGVVGFVLSGMWRGLDAQSFVALPVDRLREGDLIFRIGTDWRSEAVRGGSDDPDPYSHVGLLVGSPEHWQVLHSTPAEKPGRADGVVLDDLAFFAAAERARGIALYRVAAGAAERAAAVRFAYSRLGAPFRLVDNDTEGNYCTTFVWRAWREAGIDLGARFERVTVFSDSAHYLFPPALRRSSLLKLLYEFPRNQGR